jgi:hypothetical protein
MKALLLLETVVLSALVATMWFSTEASEAPKAPEATVTREHARATPPQQPSLKGYWDRRP